MTFSLVITVLAVSLILTERVQSFEMVKPCGHRRRYSNDELTIEERAMIVCQSELGVKVNRIAAKFGIHRNTVSAIVRKKALTGTVDNIDRQGRPKVTSAEQDTKIRVKSLRNRRLTAPEIQAEFNEVTGSQLSTSTVQRRLREAGIFGRVASKKPLLTTRHVKARLAWAKLHTNWTQKDWENVLFTDESKFEIFGGKRRLFVRRRKGEAALPQCTTSSVKHGGGSVNVWGCFGGGRIGDLHKIEGIMRKEQFHKILSHHAIPSGLRNIGRKFVYQADNDPKHTSKLCTTYLQRKERQGVLKLMKWPSQSPDLNPMELAWDELDRKVRKVQIRNEKHLVEILQESWKALDTSYFRKLTLRMPRVCRAVIKAGGKHIDENNV